MRWVQDLHRLWLYAFLGAGVLLRIIEFAAGRSLWEDEAKLALNIVERGFWELTEPMRFFQVAPIPFLWIERFFFNVIPDSDFALRIFPLLCGIGMLYPVYFLSKKLTENKTVALWTLALVAFNPFSIYYATEIKQYSSDLFVAALLPAVYLWADTLSVKRRIVALLLVVIPCLFLSYVSVVVLAALGLHRFFLWVQARKIEADYLFVFVVWGVFFLINYFVFIHGHPNKDFIVDVLGEHFMPLHVMDVSFWKWLGFHIGWIFTKTLQFPKLAGIWVLFLGAFATGIWYWAQQKKYLLIIVSVGPVAIHFVLSAMHMYAVVPRLVYYLLPFFMLAVSAGLYYWHNTLTRWRTTKYMIVGGLALLFIAWIRQIPVYNEELKSALRLLRHEIDRSEQVYLYCGAVNTYEYYEKTGFISGDYKIVEGGLYRGEPDKYLRQADSLTPPFWLLFQHVYPFDNRPNEEDLMVDYLSGKYDVINVGRFEGAALYKVELH